MLEDLTRLMMICGGASAATLLLVLGVVGFWRRGSAAQKAMALSVALIGTLGYPLTEWLSPKLEIELEPVALPVLQVSAEVMGNLEMRLPAPEQEAPRLSSVESKAPVFQSSRWSWREGAALIWITGGLLLLLRWCIGAVLLARLCRGVTPLPTDGLERLCQEAGVRRVPQLGSHPEVEIPMICGAVRPMIVLPESAVAWGSECREAVLRHELAHLRRGDLWLQKLIHLAVVVYWFNPLAWIVAARIRKEREKACDDLVVQRWGASAEYAESLLSVVKGSRFAIPAGAIGMAASSEIGARIRQILSETVNRVAPSRSLRVAMGASAMTVALLFGAVRLVEAKKAEAIPEKKETIPEKSTTIMVSDAQHAPVAAAKVKLTGMRTGVKWASHYAIPSEYGDRIAVTDAKGNATVYYPERTNDGLEVGGVTLEVKHPDFVTTHAEYRLASAKPVVLQHGVKVTLAPRNGEGPIHADLGNGYYSESVEWQQEGNELVGRVSSPQAVRTIRFNETGLPLFSSSLAVEATGKGGALFRPEVKPGRDRVGRLSDNVPRPIKAGRVIALVVTPAAVDGLLGHYWSASAEVTPSGEFTLSGLPEGELYMVAIAEGYVSVSSFPGQHESVYAQQFPMNHTSPLEIQMEKTGTARVKVLTPEGKPLEGAKVHFSPNQHIAGGSSLLGMWGQSADSLRGIKRNEKRPDWSALTNAEGVVDISGLPPGRNSFSVKAEGYQHPIGLYYDQPRRVGLLTVKGGETTEASVKLEPEKPDEMRAVLEKSQRGELSIHALPHLVRDLLTGDPLPVEPGPVLSGQVVNESGEPLAGVTVTYANDHTATTDAKGRFRTETMPLGVDPVTLQFTRKGYSPVHISTQPVGKIISPVILPERPYFEGVLRSASGESLANETIQVTTGTKRMGSHGYIVNIAYQTESDAKGRYRLHVHPDTYEFRVASKAGEVLRLAHQEIAAGEVKALDLKLSGGATLTLRLIDSVSKEPLKGVRIVSPKDGVTNRDGVVRLEGLMPGQTSVLADAGEYVRWWSPDAEHYWNRQATISQRYSAGFDPISFDLKISGMEATLLLEKGVIVSGRVLDPEGKPVKDASLAAVWPDTGEFLNHGMYYQRATDSQGRFAFKVPASKADEYVIAAHDGPYQETRHWANGTSKPLRSQPGEQVNNLTIRLNRPCIIRGRVVGADGKPPTIPQRVNALREDGPDFRFFQPTTFTDEEGRFELKHVQPGRQMVQVGSVWAPIEQAPEGSTVIVTAEPEKPVEGVDLIYHEPAPAQTFYREKD